MSTHLTIPPTTNGTAVFPLQPGWLALSAAMTAEVPTIADREDLVVTIAPGAGHGAPACLLRLESLIEVDGTHMGRVDPATARPHRIRDRGRYAPVWGLLTHECAHARHSQWTAPDGADPALVSVAKDLEESRIEAAQITRRPVDRHWLRAAVIKLVLADMGFTDPATVPQMTPQDAARAAALLLARRDGGILTGREAAPVTRAVKAVLGADTLAQLSRLWREALRVADDDATAMLDIARRWCEIIPPAQPPADPSMGSGSGDPTGHRPAPPSPLNRAIKSALRAVARAVAQEQLPPDPAADEADRQAAENAAANAATDTAARVFHPNNTAQTGSTATAGTRQPTTTEQAAARTLGRSLTTAGVRERATTKVASVLPPGRVRMRGVLTRDAQLAAGALPTAAPFTRTTRQTVPVPPLKVGIACDVSGSMGAYAGPVASTAWILANAARHTAVSTDTATVIFGNHVRPITHPGVIPTAVTEFESNDNKHAIDEAVDALDGALGLSRPGAARLVVIVSDGRYPTDSREAGQVRIDRLRAAGCAVLWLVPDAELSNPLAGGTVHVLTDPTATAQAIGRAATAALRAATR